MSEIKFEGQAALVTGASRGIGAAIALELAKRGLSVTGTATTDEGAAKISRTLAEYPGCSGKKLDVNDVSAAETLVNGIVSDFGGRLTAHNAEDGSGAVFEMALPIYDPDGGRANAPLAAE